MSVLNTLPQNRLLSALPVADYQRLAPHLEPVQLPSGKVLYAIGSNVNYFYFPTTAVISLLNVLQDGTSAEIAGIGREGVLGIDLFTGGGGIRNQAMVLFAGDAYRIRASLLVEEFNRTGGRRVGVLHRLLLRYIQARMTQISQTAACNHHHSIENRLCGWLLASLDRLSTHELRITQAAIAGTLGVRREGITEAAGRLQQAGLICSQRGRIRVLDRTGLERLACECYQVVKNEYDRLFPEVSRTRTGLSGNRQNIRAPSSDEPPVSTSAPSSVRTGTAQFKGPMRH